MPSSTTCKSSIDSDSDPTSTTTKYFLLHPALSIPSTPPSTTTPLFFLHPALHSSSSTEEPEDDEYNAEDENEPGDIQDTPEHSTGDANEPEDIQDTLEHFTAMRRCVLMPKMKMDLRVVMP
jgi:hypothetical protein